MTHEKFTIRRTGKPSLRFMGEYLGGASDHGFDDYRDDDLTLSLYRTAGGQWVAVRSHIHRNGPDHLDAKACRNLPEVYRFIGYSSAAMKLYEIADMAPIEYVV